MPALQAGASDRDGIGKTLHRADTLENVDGCNLYDEEDIIIPIFLIVA